MKQTCADCHFLVKQVVGVAAEPVVFVMTESERAKVRASDFSWQRDMDSLGCHFLVWDEGHQFQKADKTKVLTATDRQDSCFFWRHRPGMLLPAAKVLQERESKERDARHDRRLTIAGLWIAALALVAQVILQVAQQRQWWPFR